MPVPVPVRAPDPVLAGGDELTNAARLKLECGPSAVADARSFIRATLWALEVDGLLEDATVVVSELVTNAVIHARTEILVDVAVSGESVRISVSDQNSRLPTVPETPEDATNGRGLHLVAAISKDWGVDDGTVGKAVWAELRGEGDNKEEARI